GKIVAAGQTNPGSGYDDFALARYTTSGSLDTTFGSGGKVTTDFAGNYDQAYGVAIQSDGKIVAAGRGGFDFTLARYNSDGGLDTGFGSGGKVTTDFAGYNNQEAFGVATQPDGKIVLAGYTINSTGDNSDFALARYLGSAAAPQTPAGSLAA